MGTSWDVLRSPPPGATPGLVAELSAAAAGTAPDLDGGVVTVDPAGATGNTPGVVLSGPVSRQPSRHRRAPPVAGRRVLWPLGVYAASRLLLVLVMVATDLIRRGDVGGGTRIRNWPLVPGSGWLPLRIGARWDGSWYLLIAERGYGDPHAAPAASARQAFFPAYPLLIRVVSTVTRLPVSAVAPILTVAFGGVAAVLLWQLTCDLYGGQVADRAVVLFCVAPGSFVLSMAYAEGLLLAAVTGCLLALHRRRWVTAGFAGVVATAGHSDGPGLLLACAVAAAVAIRRRDHGGRSPLSPWRRSGCWPGFGWLWARSGSATRWFAVEHDAWSGSQLHLSVPVDTITRLIEHPAAIEIYGVRSLNDLVAVLGMVLMLGGLIPAVRRRLPALLVVYTGNVAVVTTLSLGARPRMVLVAVPIVIAAGASVRGRTFPAAVTLSAAALTGFALLSWASLSATP